MFKLASWNVNSLKIRLEQVLVWFEQHAVDVLALQETKLIDENFPSQQFIERGYHIAFAGQKSYNGVAFISRHPLSEITTDIPNLDDPQRRILVTTVADLRIVNLYVPNGSAVDSPKYDYKLNWLTQVHAYIKEQLNHYPKLAVVGDFNIAPEDRDVHDPEEWQGCVQVSPRERQAFAELLSLGLYDSFRLFPQAEKLYSWWDYRAVAFRRNRGLRIDHLLLNKALVDQCQSSIIDKEPRKNEQPSDHAPVMVELNTN